jgi:hypothetical protein
MQHEIDQDAEAIYAANTKRRIAANLSATDGEMTARSTVSALTRQFNVLIHEFERGGFIDARQLDLLGAQIAAAVGVVNEMKRPNLFRIAS